MSDNLPISRHLMQPNDPMEPPRSRATPPQRPTGGAGAALNALVQPAYDRDFSGLSGRDLELLLPIARRAYVEEAAMRLGIALPDPEDTHPINDEEDPR